MKFYCFTSTDSAIQSQVQAKLDEEAREGRKLVDKQIFFDCPHRTVYLTVLLWFDDAFTGEITL